MLCDAAWQPPHLAALLPASAASGQMLAIVDTCGVVALGSTHRQQNIRHTQISASPYRWNSFLQMTFVCAYHQKPPFAEACAVLAGHQRRPQEAPAVASQDLATSLDCRRSGTWQWQLP